LDSVFSEQASSAQVRDIDYQQVDKASAVSDEIWRKLAAARVKCSTISPVEEVREACSDAIADHIIIAVLVIALIAMCAEDIPLAC